MAITNTALAQAMSDLIAHWQDFQDEMQAWLAGEVGGGPSLDGKYPITDYLDVTTLVTCPAQLEDDVQNIVDGANAYATAAAASAASASTSATTATTQAGLAATARTNAETAETNAEAAQAAAESARNTAIAQASAASTSATNAAASETAAELAETNAETAETNAAASAAEAAASAAAAATFNPALYAALADAETVTGAWTFSTAITLNTGTLIEGAAGNTSLYLQHNGNASSGLLIQAANDGANTQYIWNYENSPLVFATNNAARVTVKATGEMQVAGQIRASGWHNLGGGPAALEMGVSGGIAQILGYDRDSAAFKQVTINGLYIGLAMSSGALPNYADDTAASAGGIPVGCIYRSGSHLMVRVT